jgi:hypothetical protein
VGGVASLSSWRSRQDQRWEPEKIYLGVVAPFAAPPILVIVSRAEVGLVAPRALTIGGVEITPFISVVPFMIMGGFVLLYLFYRWIRRLHDQGREPLLSPGLVRTQPLQSGLLMLAVQYCTIAGTFFVMPVYLQLTLQKNALQTGIVLLPLAAGVVVFSLPAGASACASRQTYRAVGIFSCWRPRHHVAHLARAEESGSRPACAPGAAPAVLGSAASTCRRSRKRTSEVGHTGVFQNIGRSLEHRLIGAILMVGLERFQARILANPAIPATWRTPS